MTRKQLKRRIRECETEIENIKALPYYSIFNRQYEQEADLKALQEDLERLLSKLAVTVFSPRHAVILSLSKDCRSAGMSEAVILSLSKDLA